MNNTITYDEKYAQYALETHADIRAGIKVWDDLPANTPREVKDALWKALGGGLHMSQDILHLVRKQAEGRLIHLPSYNA